MSLISRNINNRTVSRGLGGVITTSEDDGCEKVSIVIEAIVVIEEEFYPNTISKGWEWNRSIPQDKDSIRSRIENTVGGYSLNLEEGSVEVDWVGAAKSGLGLSKLKSKKILNSKRKWIPEIETGVYSVLNKTRSLGSKDSYSKVLSALTSSIGEAWLDTTIQISSFIRDLKFSNIPKHSWVYDEALNSKYTYKVDGNQLVVNTLDLYQVGCNSLEAADIKCHDEYKGFGESNREIVYTKQFPCIDTKVTTIKNNEVYEWTKVDNFRSSSSVDRHYIVDELNGKIVFQSKVPSKKYFVKEDLGSSIEVFEPLEELLESGFITIDNVEVEYKSKSKYKLFFENRPQGTTSQGDYFTLTQKGKFLDSEEIYLAYKVAPRLDVNLSQKNFETDLNIKPYRSLESSGILQLDVDNINVGSLALSCSKPNIVSNIFGPVKIGSDTVRLEATALNRNIKPVEEIKITFKAEEGSLEGEGLENFKVTNLDGKAFCSYFYEYEEKSLYTITNPKHIGVSSYFEVNNLPPGLSKEDIGVFQILKTDPLKGSLGIDYDVESYDYEDNSIELSNELLDSEEYKTLYDTLLADGIDKSNINQELCLNTYYNFGMAIVYYANGLATSKEVILRSTNKKIFFEDTEIQNKIAQFGNIVKVKVFKRGELVFNMEEVHRTGKSFDRLLYKYSEEEELHLPLRCNRIVGNRLFYDNILLPRGEALEESNIIAGYKVFYPQTKSVFAEAEDPSSGNIVRSNEIKLKLEFPDYLKGSRGFKFIEASNIEEGGLGGTVFLTVNPEITNSVNIFI